MSQAFDYNNLTDLPHSVHRTWTVLAIINAIAAPPTTAVNLLIIWTILKDENLKMSIFNNLLSALAVTDLIGGLVVQPLFCWYIGSLLLRRPWPCIFTIYGVPTIVCSSLTLCTLTVTIVDRYVAIEHAQFYLENITVKKVLFVTVVVGVIMLTSVFGGIALVDGADNLRKLPAAAVGAINVLVILYCAIRVQVTAYRQRKNIQAQADAVIQLEENAQTVAVQKKEKDEKHRRRKQYKQAITTSMLVVASILCYCPYIITAVIQSTKGKDVTNDFIYISHPIAATFVHLQSLVNPTILSLRLSYIRKGVKQIVCKILTPKYDEQQSSVHVNQINSS